MIIALTKVVSRAEHASSIKGPGPFEKKFSILREISDAIVLTDNINAIFGLILKLAMNYTRAGKGSVMLVDERDELYILAAKGIEDQLAGVCRMKVGEGIADTLAENRESVLAGEMERAGRFKDRTGGRYRGRSFISCPIVSNNRLLGVLNINDKPDDAHFTGDEFALIKTIADQAAIALEKAALTNQLKAKAAELEEMNRKLMESDAVKTGSLIHISHELRTPLNSIKGAIYCIRESGGLPQGEQGELHSIISGETDRLIALVENLLDFLRLEDEARGIKKSVASLTALNKPDKRPKPPR